MTLSVCIIAHNEEAKLQAALDSVRFADEVIVADCESQDLTGTIARDWGAFVFNRPNLANLNVNKNFIFGQATGDFILSLDADEVVPEEAAREIEGILQGEPSESGFLCPRRNYWLGQWLKHGGHYPDRQLRLFRRGKGRFPERHLHERLRLEGRLGRLRNPLDHFPYETREECLRKLEFYTSFEANFLFERGVRPSPINALRYLYWKPAVRFLRRYIFKLGFLDSSPGWEAALMDMQNFRQRYEKLCKLVSERADSV